LICFINFLSAMISKVSRQASISSVITSRITDLSSSTVKSETFFVVVFTLQPPIELQPFPANKLLIRIPRQQPFGKGKNFQPPDKENEDWGLPQAHELATMGVLYPKETKGGAACWQRF
jgi:hypothetical protein